MPKIIKNSTLTNNKKEIEVTKNGKNLLAPRFQSPSVQPSRVHVFRIPESKCPAVQSPSVQLSRVQDSSRPESRCTVVLQESRVQASRPYTQSTVFPVCRFKHWHSNLDAIYCNRFCKNVL